MPGDELDPTPAIQSRIEAAKEHLDQAERELRDVLAEIERLARAHKVIVGEPLRAALDQLTETRVKLEAALRSSE
jgi:predicted  nucleic acid-binding Zn-ribbon protein